MEIDLPIKNFPKQQSIFDSQSRYTIVAKGRRFGLTKGAANNFIKCALEETFLRGLWVDVVNTNIDKYIERYFIPHLNKLPKNVWEWRKQAKMLIINKAYIDFRSADRPECYDDQTEVLTNEGWKYFKDLTKKEEVFTLNPDNLTAQWKKPIAYVNRPYKGEMKHFCNNKVDLLVTPNHKFLVQRNNGKRVLKQIESCNSHDKIPASIQFGGIDIPEMSEELCAFIGFYLAEGSHDKNKGGYRIRFAQTDGIKGGIKGDVKKDFLTILDSLGINYNINYQQISLINKKLWLLVNELGNTYNKFIPQRYKELPPDKLQIIIDWLIKGDGTIRQRNDDKAEEVFYSVSKRLADDFQELLVKTGRSGTVFRKSTKDYTRYFKDRLIKATTECYGVSVYNNKFTYFSNGQENFVKQEYYDGRIYCLEVENHVILVRRNGKICWSGNTMEGFGYDKAFLNEAGIILKNEYLWDNAIRPMFWDYPNLRAVIGGTPKGKGKLFELAERGKDPEQTLYNFLTFTSFDNPFIDLNAIREDMASMPERVIQQEIYAQFLEDTGVVFRNFLEIMDAEPLKPMSGHRYIMGVDLAKVEDFTVLAVYDAVSNKQVYQARFNQLDWGMQKARIAETARHYTDGTSPAQVVIDATGLGDPIVDDLARMGIPVDPIKFTNDQKRQLIEKLVNWIELKRIHMLPIEETKRELTNFTYDISDLNDRVRYEAPVGFHDDIIIAHALAVWRLIIKEKEATEKPKTLIRLSYEKALKTQVQEIEPEIAPQEWKEWEAI